MPTEHLKINNFLVVNSGSTSLKMSMFQALADQGIAYEPAWELEKDIDWQHETREDVDQKVDSWLSQLWQGEKPLLKDSTDINIVGHRIVHGGPYYSSPTRIDDTVQQQLEMLTEFAPLHNPINVRALKVVRHLLPKAAHIAVFDTAFHVTLPEKASIYPVPYSWYENWKIKKYGFHGISHQYCSIRAGQILGQKELPRMVNCHLGGGCSLAAIDSGKSIDTTMGFTPLDGLMMTSRSGAVDPGMLIYLLKVKQIGIDDLNATLNKQSGLKGIYEKTGDMRQILGAMANGDARAQLAFDMFMHRLCAGIAAMCAALGTVDVISFTGGIGEHSAEIRSAACKQLSFLNLELDQSANQSKPIDADVSKPGTKVRVLVIKTREDWQIANQCREFS